VKLIELNQIKRGNIMDIERKANESKKRTNIMNGISIDWQYAQQLIPQVLNEPKDITPEFKMLCDNLTKFCINIEEGIKELRALIPNSPNE
jgi:hypothetical protein